MAKVTNLRVNRLAGDQRGKVRGSWSPPTGNVTKSIRSKKKGSAKAVTHTKAWCVDKYEYRWVYRTLVRKEKGFDNPRTYTPWATTTARQLEWSVPKGATAVHLQVRPISKKYSHYKSASATKASELDWISSDVKESEVCNTGAFHVPERPDIQSASVGSDGVTVTAKMSSSDPYAMSFEAQLVRDKIVDASGSSSIKTDTFTYDKGASIPLKGTPGRKYKVRARIRNIIGEYSAWVTFPEQLVMRPAPAPRPTASALADGSCTVSWDAVDGAESYEIAYGGDPRDLDASGDYSVKKEISGTSYTFRDLDPGQQWCFWVRGVNGSGDGAWSGGPAFVILGLPPTAPTVMAEDYVVVRGEPARAMWVHNSADGSEQSKARVMVKRGSAGSFSAVNVSGSTSVLDIDTGSVPDGQCVEFYVNTWGVLTGSAFMSPASETRSVRVWERPSAALSAPSTVESFPFALSVAVSASAQTPVFASMVISARSTHEVVGLDGETRTVAAGDVLWSGQFSNPANPLVVNLSAGDIDLESGQTYDVSATCAMSSGLSCSASSSFGCSWEGSAYSVYADLEQWGEYGCEITPRALVPFDPPPGEPETADGWVSEPVLAEDVTLSIYRRDGRGSLDALMTGIPNDGTWSLVDDHASRLRWMYRIVAVNAATGEVSYADVSGAPVENAGGLVLSWGGDSLAAVQMIDGEEVGDAPSSSVVLSLPWDVTPSEDADPDSEYVAYIGDTDPTGYWGTQLGRSARWETRIPRDDTDTLDKLRALAVRCGEVYAREPLGDGYWCGVRVSMTAPAHEGEIKVTIDATPTATRDECIALDEPAVEVVMIEGGGDT